MRVAVDIRDGEYEVIERVSHGGGRRPAPMRVVGKSVFTLQEIARKRAIKAERDLKLSTREAV